MLLQKMASKISGKIVGGSVVNVMGIAGLDIVVLEVGVARKA